MEWWYFARSHDKSSVPQPFKPLLVMKKAISIIFLFGIMIPEIYAQDIADVGVKSRFEKSRGIYLAGGPAFVQGALGDYSNGLGIETGFMKRLNKVMSIGAGLSYLSFNYDSKKTHPDYYNPDAEQTVKLSLGGGDVSLLSAGFNFKLNLIPVSDHTTFSVYGIGTPFVSYYSRGEVSGNGALYNYNATSGKYDIFVKNDPWTKADFPVLKSESKITGGVYLGRYSRMLPVQRAKLF